MTTLAAPRVHIADLIVEELPMPALPIGSFRIPPRRQSVQNISAVAIVCSILVHVFAAVTLLGAGRAREIPEIDPTAGVHEPHDSFAMRSTYVYFLEEGTADTVESPSARTLPPTLTPTLLRLHLRVSDIPHPALAWDALYEAPSAEPEATSLQGDSRAALHALYVRQVRARIERAWQEQPLRLTDRCSIRVTQSDVGDVEKIELLRCGLDRAARAALIAAVGRASPLPAPPEHGVFQSSLVVEFGDGSQPL